jgi:hypothetical protein
MGWRFSKRIRILPGIRLNISKSGISTTDGPQGASVNIGKKGTYLNTGIPGTGISHRQRLSNANFNGSDLAQLFVFALILIAGLILFVYIFSMIGDSLGPSPQFSQAPSQVQPLPQYGLPDSGSSSSDKTVHVQSYVRKDGTVVQSHTRSSPRR